MNPFIREKRDGRRAPGYLVYLLAGGGAIAAVAILHRNSAPAPAARAPGARGARVSQIAQPASPTSQGRTEKGAVPSPERSVRMPASQGQSAARRAAPVKQPAPGAFDPIGAALAGSPPNSDSQGSGPGGPALDEGPAAPAPASNFALLPPAFSTPAGRANASPAEKNEPAQLLSYRDPSADVSSDDRAGEEAPAGGRLPVHVVPKGTLLKVCLLTTVDTSNPTAVIQFGVTGDLIFNRRRQLEFGVRLLGRVSGRPMRNRLNLTVDTVLYPDGLELPVKASAVEADEIGCNIHPGVGARYVPPPAWVQATPYAADLFAGVMGILQSRASQQLTLGTGGLALQPSAPEQVRGAAYQASAHAVDDFAEARLKEIEERYAAYYLVPAGTACCMQLDADLDLTAAFGSRRPPAQPPADRPQDAQPTDEPHAAR